jgi:Flp pilus assembly protein TadD
VAAPPPPPTPVETPPPALVAAAPAVAPAVVPPAPAPAPVAAAPQNAQIEQTCRDAFSQKRSKDVLDSCGRAFEASPAAGELAVMVAESELDRGRAASALTWARKAVAVDPNLADAYVFIGTAEQQAGHAQAARTAYLKYLELAPAGRFAQDLKSVVAGIK